MDNIIKKINGVINPPKNTIIDDCTEYMKENPSTVIKGAAIGVTTMYTIPIVLGTLAWAPYIGTGYYIYTNIKDVIIFKNTVIRIKQFF